MRIPNSNSHPEVFMLPELEAYIHGAKFKSKLNNWNKTQGFKELKVERLQEWCLDTIVLEALLKINNYAFSPVGTPVSPLTPEPNMQYHILDKCDSTWMVPPCRGNLLDDYKTSTRCNPDFSSHSRTHATRHGFKKIWKKMTRQHSYATSNYELSNLFTPPNIVPDLDLHSKHRNKYSSIYGSTNVLKLLLGKHHST